MTIMKVNAMISLYNARVKHAGELDLQKMQNIIKDLIKPVSYISYDQKLQLVECVIKDNVGATFPTAEIYRSFIIYLVNAYTILELDKKGFDIIMENKMLDIILSTFQAEYELCNTLLQMCLDDSYERGGRYE